VACAMAAVYLVTRVIFIDRFPVFFDEALYADWARQGAHSLHALFLSETIGREPLLPWLAVPLIKVGVAPLTAVRVISVAAGLVTIGVVGWLAVRLGGIATGVVAALLCVVLPLFVVHDGIAIYEPLVTLVMASALVVQIELARRPDLRWGLLLGGVFCLALLTKENTSPAILLTPLSLLCFDWRAPERRRRLTLWAAAVAIALIGAVAAELILRSSSYYHSYVSVRKTSWYTVRSLSSVLADPFTRYTKTAWFVLRDTLSGYVTLPVIGAAVVGAALLARTRLRLLVVLVAWLVMPVLGVLLFSTFPFPRHYMYVLPPVLVLAAYGIVQVIRALPRVLPAALVAPVAGVAMMALLVPALLFDGRVLANPKTFHYPSYDDWQYVTGTGAGAPWAPLAAAIRRHAVGSHVVIVNSNASQQPLRLKLDYSSRFSIVLGSNPAARSAQFVYAEAHGGPFDAGAMEIVRRGGFRVIGSFGRPRPCGSPRPPLITCPAGGERVLLYERSGLSDR
jgi:4-amino-4-deoxy-L-arabinose transferase-like glycosyltransferase